MLRVSGLLSTFTLGLVTLPGRPTLPDQTGVRSKPVPVGLERLNNPTQAHARRFDDNPFAPPVEPPADTRVIRYTSKVTGDDYESLLQLAEKDLAEKYPRGVQ